MPVDCRRRLWLPWRRRHIALYGNEIIFDIFPLSPCHTYQKIKRTLNDLGDIYIKLFTNQPTNERKKKCNTKITEVLVGDAFWWQTTYYVQFTTNINNKNERVNKYAHRRTHTHDPVEPHRRNPRFNNPCAPQFEMQPLMRGSPFRLLPTDPNDSNHMLNFMWLFYFWAIVAFYFFFYTYLYLFFCLSACLPARFPFVSFLSNLVDLKMSGHRQ